MPLFADVVLLKESKALGERRFTYAVPPQWTPQVGQLVRVPFAHQGMLPALVMHLHDDAPQGFVAKPLTALISPSAFFTAMQVAMLTHIAEDTMTPFAQVVLAALPSSFLTLQTAQFAPPQTLLLRLLEEPDSLPKLTARQKEVYHGLLNLRNETGEVEWACRILQAQLGCTKSVLEKLVQAGLAEWQSVVAYRTPLKIFERKRLQAPPLNASQNAVFQQMQATLETPYHPHTHRMVLHGVTGSGKTEVYMAMAEKLLAEGKSVLILVPEIALTGALAERFLHRFGLDTLAMWHSQLSMGEKLDTWQRIADGELRLVIGARSAIFTPMKDLGLIILDEFHDGSFKQETPAPRYHVRKVANWLSESYQIPLLLGSATPEVGVYHQAVETKTHQLLELHDRHGGATLPKVHLVDMKLERSHGHLHAISRPLQKALKDTLERGEQAIILLNRRGFHTFVDCHSCGHVFECPDCSVSMTYHKEAKIVKCHHCGFTAERPQYCPKCGSLHLQFVGSGTQKIEAELSELLGNIPILRLDGDIMQKKGAFKEVLDAFKNKESPVLVGTQMVAKGLDVENVTLVGVMGADASFYMPDFMAHERGFQLLTQVAGRAGRGTKAGQVYLQSWQVEHPVLALAMRQDLQGFYRMEIDERRANQYPPFTQLIRLLVSGQELERVRFFAKGLKQALLHRLEMHGFQGGLAFQLLGPAPCLIERLQGKFRYHVLIKNHAGKGIHTILADFLKDLPVPEGLHCLVDVDVQQLL
ncbi:MAG: primosomal protein N' [Vampirovibrionales bacterium]|nr:primosomal protein N' [Vampirovibrionales bacterium]